MWEEYLIKRHINYSRGELYAMPAEERRWFMRRIEEDLERKKQAAESGHLPPHSQI